jgi:hypothetical protein
VGGMGHWLKKWSSLCTEPLGWLQAAMATSSHKGLLSASAMKHTNHNLATYIKQISLNPWQYDGNMPYDHLGCR